MYRKNVHTCTYTSVQCVNIDTSAIKTAFSTKQQNLTEQLKGWVMEWREFREQPSIKSPKNPQRSFINPLSAELRFKPRQVWFSSFFFLPAIEVEQNQPLIVVTLLNQTRTSLRSQLGSSGGRANVMRDPGSDWGPGCSFLHNHIINLLIPALTASWQICLRPVHNGEGVLSFPALPPVWKTGYKAHSFTAHRGSQTKQHSLWALLGDKEKHTLLKQVYPNNMSAI